MNITAIFIRRPVMTTLVMAAILVFGGLAYTRLPVSDLPTVDFPTITVSANWSPMWADTQGLMPPAPSAMRPCPSSRPVRV